MDTSRQTEVPQPHADFLRRAVEQLSRDARLVGIAAAGSYLTRSLDEFSDLDLVIAVESASYAEVLADRQEIARRLGPLLAAFTGEHVGEPRLLICLYGPPLLHVDLKYVDLAAAHQRVEDPDILWERDGRLSAALARGEGRFPQPDPQWIEDRFWVWVHYGAGKIGRGEMFEAVDSLAFLRAQVLGPLALAASGARPTGVRRLEVAAPEWSLAIQATLAGYEPRSCAAALRAAVEVYRQLRAGPAFGAVRRHEAAETAAMDYLADIEARCR